MAGEFPDEAVSGCRILYAQDYDSEIKRYDLPFDSAD